MRDPHARPQTKARLAARVFAAGLYSGLLALSLAAQSPTEATLERVKARVRQSLERLPNHTCRMEVRRAHLGADVRDEIAGRIEGRNEELAEKVLTKAEQLRKGGPQQVLSADEEYRAIEEQFGLDVDVPLDVIDSIALEVAFVSGRELYAFPDSPRFEDIPLAQLIGHGTVVTGVFAGHTKSILVDEVGTIAYSGEELVDGRRVFRYAYSVSLADSQYSVNNKGQATRVPYHGSFWASADGDLLRLTVLVDELPVDVGVESFATQIDYTTIAGTPEPFLAAERSRFSMLLSTGVESVSETRFEDCRAFVGSSVLSFDDQSLRYYVERTETLENLEIPLGTALPVEVTTPIDSKTSRVGDRVEAKLTRNVRLGKDSTIPKDATLRGRLRRLEFYGGGQSYFGVGIEFQEVLFDDSRAVVSLQLDRIGSNTMGVQKEEPITWVGSTFQGLSRANDGVYTDMRNSTGAASAERPPDIYQDSENRFVAHGLFGVGVFYIYRPRTDEFRLPPGLRLTWRTVARSGEPGTAAVR